MHETKKKKTHEKNCMRHLHTQKNTDAQLMENNYDNILNK